MTVRLKDVITTFNLVGGEQIGSKQLFKGYSEIYKANVYISYRTVIAFEDAGVWWITGEWFSRTTTNHKSEIRKLEKNVVIHEEYDFKVRLDRMAMLSLL